MAFVNGFWEPENDNVQKQVAKVAGSGSPLMKQAAGLGAAFANSRGLQNSSIGAKASQDAVLERAVAIGGQQSAQTHAKNLAALNAAEQFKYGTTLQEMQDTAAEERLRMQVASTEKISDNEIRAAAKLQARDLNSQMQRLTKQLNNANFQQRKQIQAEMQMLGKQINANQKLANTNNAAEMRRLRTTLGGQKEMTAMEIAGQLSGIKLNLASNEKIAGREIASQERMQGRQIGSAERLATQAEKAALERLTTQIDAAKGEQKRALEAQRENLLTEIQSREGMQSEQIASAERMATQAEQAELKRLKKQLDSSEGMQKAQYKAQMEQLQTEIAARSELATEAQRAEMERLTTQIDAAKGEQKRTLEAQMEQLQAEIGSNAALQQMRGSQAMALQELQGNQNIELQQGQIAAAQQEQINSAVTSMTTAYQQMIAAITQNPDIPAATREQYMRDAQAATEANIGLIEQIFSIDLGWGNNRVGGSGSGGGSGGSLPPNAGPNPIAGGGGNTGGGGYPIGPINIGGGTSPATRGPGPNLQHQLAQINLNPDGTYSETPPPAPPPAQGQPVGRFGLIPNLNTNGLAAAWI